MDKQIIKKLIIEKQKAIPEFFIIRREIQFDTHANYVLDLFKARWKILYDVSGCPEYDEESRADTRKHTLHKFRG